MSYTPLPLHLEVVHEYDASTIEEDAVSMLSDAAPHAGYVPYRPPKTTPESSTETSFIIEHPPVLPSPTRLPTPPKLLPIIWPGVYPSRTPSSRTQSKAPSRIPSREPSRTLSSKAPSRVPSRTASQLPSRSPSTAPSKTPSQSLSLRLFNFNLPALNTNIAPYSEALPWANSTHFRTTSDGSRENAGLIDPSDPPSKQYFRNPRHIRQPWRSGRLRRFPWRAASALLLILLLTGASLTTTLSANNTSPSTWRPAQPPTYLAVFELLTTLCTLYVAAHGFVLAFWIRLVRRGGGSTSLADVHDVYASSKPWHALRCVWRRQVNRVGIASLGAVVSVVRGPMVQRALTLRTDGYSVGVPYLVVGVMCSVVSVLTLIPLYQGYWVLGRDVSLNPLEVARAFGAPLFEGVDGNGTARDVEMERGVVMVRYGAVEGHGREKVLRVEDTGRVNVRGPREGEIFG